MSLTHTQLLSAKAKWTTYPGYYSKICSKVAGPDPMDGEQYPWVNSILDPLQDYAFTKGFAVVTLTGSEKKGRMRFGCVYHGKPRDRLWHAIVCM